jgi:nucleoside-triphosphatase
MRWFLTGGSGIGKTTLCLNLAEKLRKQGISCGGVVSREIREGGARVGFEFVDMESGEIYPLSSILGQGPRVGKYHVNLDGISRAIAAVDGTRANVVFLDELGPLELKSPGFKQMVDRLLSTDRTAVIVVHRNLAPNFTCIEVTTDNRDDLVEELSVDILQNL